MSVRKRSARRCRRTMRSPSCCPVGVSRMPSSDTIRPSASRRFIISLTAGRLICSRSAIRAWMISTSSSPSSKMHSQYSSNAGWCSPESAWERVYSSTPCGSGRIRAPLHASIRHTGAMVASLIARGVTVSQGPLLVLADVDLTVAPGHGSASSGRTGWGRPRCSPRSPGGVRSTPERRGGTARLCRRVAPAGAGTIRARDGARVPRATCRHHRRRGPSGVGHRRARRGRGGQRRHLQHGFRPVDDARGGRLRRPRR